MTFICAEFQLVRFEATCTSTELYSSYRIYMRYVTAHTLQLKVHILLTISMFGQPIIHIQCRHVYQQRFSGKMGVNIIIDYLIGPYILPKRLDGRCYQNFLEQIISVLQQNVSIASRNRIGF